MGNRFFALLALTVFLSVLRVSACQASEASTAGPEAVDPDPAVSSAPPGSAGQAASGPTEPWPAESERILERLFELLGREEWAQVAEYDLPANLPPRLEAPAFCLKAAAYAAMDDIDAARDFLDPDSPGFNPLSLEPEFYLAGERKTGLGYLALREGSLREAAGYLNAGFSLGCLEAALGLRAVSLAAGEIPPAGNVHPGGDCRASCRFGRALDAAFHEGEWERLFSMFPGDGGRFPVSRQGDILFFGNPAEWTGWIASGLNGEQGGNSAGNSGDRAVLAAVRANRTGPAADLVSALSAAGNPVSRRSAAAVYLAAGRAEEAIAKLLPEGEDEIYDAGTFAGLAAALEAGSQEPGFLHTALALGLPVDADPPLAAAAAVVLAGSHPGKTAKLIETATSQPAMYPRAAIEGYRVLLCLAEKNGRSDRELETAGEALLLFPRETWLLAELASACADEDNAAGVIRAVEAAMENGPLSPDMRFGLFKVCRRAGMRNLAASLLEGIDSETVFAGGDASLLASWFAAEGRFEKAYELYGRLAADRPGNPGYFLQRARLGVKLGFAEEAAADLVEWLRLTAGSGTAAGNCRGSGPDPPDPLSWLGGFTAFDDTLDGDCVLETVERAGEAMPLDPRLVHQRALVLEYCGSPGDAAGILAEVVFEAASENRLLRNAGRIFRSGGLHEKAFDVRRLLLEKEDAFFGDTLSMMVSALETGEYPVILHMAGRMPPGRKTATVLYLEGAAARAMDLCERSLPPLRKAVSLAPGTLEFVKELAEATICSGKAFEGELALETWISDHPEHSDPGSLSLLGRCALETGNTFKAGAMFRMALTIEACNRDALAGLVVLAETEGDETAVLAGIERFLLCYPESAAAYRTLAGRYHEAGRIDDAAWTLERFRAASEGFAPPDMEYLGDLYVAAELPDLAASRYRAALEMESGLISCRFKLALVEILIGREKEAAVLLEEYLRRALPGHPDFEAARRLLARLRGENY